MKYNRIVKTLLISILLVQCSASYNQGSISKYKNKSKINMENIKNSKKAVFGTGCFWCSEAVYENIEGVFSVVSGYAGGDSPNPTYETVSSGSSTHAEVIEITYDPGKVEYKTLLEVFWKTHDPTTLNRQGNDVGPQYRSIILYNNEVEKNLAEKSMIAAQNTLWKEPIVTEIKKLDKFYKAEEYHQDYYRQNKTSNPYCYFVIGPKLKKFEKEFASLLNKAKTK